MHKTETLISVHQNAHQSVSPQILKTPVSHQPFALRSVTPSLATYSYTSWYYKDHSVILGLKPNKNNTRSALHDATTTLTPIIIPTAALYCNIPHPALYHHILSLITNPFHHVSTNQLPLIFYGQTPGQQRRR